MKFNDNIFNYFSRFLKKEKENNSFYESSAITNNSYYGKFVLSSTSSTSYSN